MFSKNPFPASSSSHGVLRTRYVPSPRLLWFEGMLKRKGSPPQQKKIIINHTTAPIHFPSIMTNRTVRVPAGDECPKAPAPGCGPVTPSPRRLTFLLIRPLRYPSTPSHLRSVPAALPYRAVFRPPPREHDLRLLFDGWCSNSAAGRCQEKITAIFFLNKRPQVHSFLAFKGFKTFTQPPEAPKVQRTSSPSPSGRPVRRLAGFLRDRCPFYSGAERLVAVSGTPRAVVFRPWPSGGHSLAGQLGGGNQELGAFLKLLICGQWKFVPQFCISPVPPCAPKFVAMRGNLSSLPPAHHACPSLCDAFVEGRDATRFPGLRRWRQRHSVTFLLSLLF